MKVTLRKESGGGYSIYVAKKDLEAQVVEAEREPPWGGTVLLDNGWRLAMPEMAADTRMPITVEARKVGE
jgi:nitrogen fixation protein NifT